MVNNSVSGITGQSHEQIFGRQSMYGRMCDYGAVAMVRFKTTLSVVSAGVDIHSVAVGIVRF